MDAERKEKPTEGSLYCGWCGGYRQITFNSDGSVTDSPNDVKMPFNYEAILSIAPTKQPFPPIADVANAHSKQFHGQLGTVNIISDTYARITHHWKIK